jgi:hypothetical protein
MNPNSPQRIQNLSKISLQHRNEPCFSGSFIDLPRVAVTLGEGLSSVRRSWISRDAVGSGRRSGAPRDCRHAPPCERGPDDTRGVRRHRKIFLCVDRILSFRRRPGRFSRMRIARIAIRIRRDSPTSRGVRDRAWLSVCRSRPADSPCRRSISSPARRTIRSWWAWPSPVRPCRDWPR